MNPEPVTSSREIEILAWLEINKWRLAIAVAILGVLAGAVSLYRWYDHQRELKASSALFLAAKPIGRGPDAKPPSSSALDKVVSDFSGTSAGARALLMAAGSLFREGKYAEAQTRFERYQKENPDSPFAATAALGVAACYDAVGKTNEARAAYLGVVSGYPNSPVANQARLSLASLQQARNENLEAFKTYTEAINVQQSVWRPEAVLRRDQLLSRHPELATNPAVASLLPQPPATNPAASLVLPAGAAPAPR
jgi:predicted negative regulator of RcsB-dependent stress response